jgi:hypothetical protein
VTHRDAIAHVLALASDDAAVRPSGGVRQTVIAHFARCSDCWHTLGTLHLAATGERLPEDAAMAARFGCEQVRDRLFELVDLDPREIARTQAAAARHLGWCLACRTRLAELVDVEREQAARPRWVDVGAQVREAVGRVVVRLGRVVSGLVEVPETFVVGPALVPVAARGAAAAAPPALAQSARFQLGDTPVWVELGVDAGDDAATGLTLRLTAAVPEPLSVHLREARADGDALIARYTLRGTDPVLVRGLWPGSFLVELHDPRDAHVHRVRVDIGRGA